MFGGKSIKALHLEACIYFVVAKERVLEEGAYKRPLLILPLAGPETSRGYR